MNAKKLREIYGSLKHIRTEDKQARRRFRQEEDENIFVILDGDSFCERPFAIDHDNKLMPSKALRRAGDKTQVFTDPMNLHIRNRASHTNEVVGLATCVGGILGLNTDLCRAIALGHDLGHTPFGHSGEKFISKVTGKHFEHNIFASVLLQSIERSGRGLNLTHQVLTGIVNHSGVPENMDELNTVSPEASVVRLVDKIAYILADWNDIARTSFHCPEIVALRPMIEELGRDQRNREAMLIHSLCLESAKCGKITFAQCNAGKIFSSIRSQMKKLYPLMNCGNSGDLLGRVYELIERKVPDVQPEIALALMTDHEVLCLVRNQTFSVANLYQTSLGEIIPFIRGRRFDFTNPDLNW